MQAICPWLPSAPTHTQAHIAMRPCGRPAAARHNSRQQLERSATLTAPASQQHVIRSSFLPTSASVLRTFGTSGHFAVLPKEQPHRATRANVAPNSPKSCQTKWFQTFQAGFTSLLIRKQPQSACAHQRFSSRSPDDGQPITITSGPAAAKSYTNPVSRSCWRIHIRKLHPSRYIGSRFGGFFLLSAEL